VDTACPTEKASKQNSAVRLCQPVERQNGPRQSTLSKKSAVRFGLPVKESLAILIGETASAPTSVRIVASDVKVTGQRLLTAQMRTP